ncbi:MAG: T9SS type A sorting domain-containing protein [Bacteroidetes bacterium]|nr:T9SS type A sorting domain-containing protein [Bacteroidota bacterium]
MQRMTPIFTVAMLLLFGTHAMAQVSVSALSTPYTQDFNTLINTGSASFVSNSTISGWYHARTGTGDLIVAGTGSSNSGALYSFGAASSTERALGSVGSSNGAVGNLWWGVRLVNNTGATITSLAISYTGEQWRYSGTAAAQTVTFSYQTGTNLTSLTTGSWTDVTALDFTSPIISGTTSALDGNLPANQTVLSTVLSITLSPGDEVMLRWYDPDHSGSDHGLAIDDFSVTAYGAAAPTVVEFGSTTSSFLEDAGTVTINVSITNPSPSTATTVDVVLTGGSATNGTDNTPAFATQTLTFPAGSSLDQTVSLTLVDDAIFEGNEDFTFALQNVAGGNTASIGAQSTHTLTILENDPPPMPSVIVNEYFNAYGNLGTDEGVELFVVSDGLDMRGWSLADATSGGTYPYGVVTFSNDPLWSNLQAGTIIVIGGIYSVPIQDLDASDGLLLVQAPANGNSNQYFTHSSNAISIAGSSDGIAIRDAAANFVHGLAHGSNNQNTFPTGMFGWKSGSLASTESLGFSRTGAAMLYTDFLVNTYVGVVLPSLGDANDADGNLAYLRSIRSRMVTANRGLTGSFFWDITVQNGATLTQSGPVTIGNLLFVEEGSYNENGQGLSIDGAGNAQNGTGAGNLTVGDDMGSSAMLLLPQNPLTVSGTMDFDHSDATVHFLGTTAQTILPAEYFNLTLSNGGQPQPKSVTGAVSVYGALTINASAWLQVQKPQVIVLGEFGTYVNNGRFFGDIRSSRMFYGGIEDFGGIGITLQGNQIETAPAAVPGLVTVTMTSGEYIWVGNLPSILRYYKIDDSFPNAMPVTMIVDYAQQDLNGQTEASLQLHKSGDNGATWNSRTSTLNTSANTLTLDLTDIDGMWTMHANPAQGMIMTDPVAMTFEAEENGPLPATQDVDVWNAYGNGSIIDWTATSSTIELPAWMSLTPAPATGHNDGSFTVSVTRTNMTPGWHYGSITVSDPHASNSPVIIPVSYRVYEPRKISIGTDTLRIKVTYKRVAVTTSIPVVNGGEAFGPGVIAWNASTSTPWLTMTNGSGLEGDAFTLQISALTKPSGTYTGEIVITGTNSVTNNPIVNSPLTIPVILEVEPWDQVVQSVSSLPMGSSVSFFNPLGHIIAKLEVTGGTLQSFSMRLMPYGLPRNIQRLRYAYRHYIISATGTYTSNLTLYYTLSERGQTGITEPELLRLWRQVPNQFSWVQFPGYSTPVAQSVTGVGLGDLNGIWGMAYPFFPEQYVINAKANWIAQDRAQLAWTDVKPANELGYAVERSAMDRDDWQTVGIVLPSANGSYHFEDAAVSTQGWRYRLLSFDSEGNAWQSESVELAPMGILANGELSAMSFALEQNTPNPASLASGSAAVRFSIPSASAVRLALYDATGREIAVFTDGLRDAGVHSLRIPLAGLAPGMYFYRLTSSSGTLTKAMVVTR